ncbi:hypothetical protein MKX03_037941, partial [Papaver bracteatum]
VKADKNQKQGRRRRILRVWIYRKVPKQWRPIDFEKNHGQLPNFGTRKPVELQPNNLGYNQYIGMNYPPSNYGPSSRADWDYGTTDPNFRYHRDARRKAVEHADYFCTDLFRLPPPPPPQPPQPPRRGRIPLFYGF